MFSHLDLLFSSTPLEGPEQMALDEVLLRQISSPLLRLYCWKAPCVTFGYFQEWKKVQAAFPGRTLVRRWSGGGSVEHDRDMTFSLIVPASKTPKTIARIPPSFFYQYLHQAIVETLHAFKIDARLINSEETKEGSSCFTAPSLHDIVIQDQKIAGGAQRRCAGSLLHQGSLNYVGRWKMADGRWDEVLDPSVMGKSLFTSLAKRLSPSVNLIAEEQAWLEEAVSVATQRYRTTAWTQKR
ncbi:MAG: lipoate--protein ligase family protein [Chthoniobacterales bacterium]